MLEIPVEFTDVTTFLKDTELCNEFELVYHIDDAGAELSVSNGFVFDGVYVALGASAFFVPNGSSESVVMVHTPMRDLL